MSSGLALSPQAEEPKGSEQCALGACETAGAGLAAAKAGLAGRILWRRAAAGGRRALLGLPDQPHVLELPPLELLHHIAKLFVVGH